MSERKSRLTYGNYPLPKGQGVKLLMIYNNPFFIF